MMRVWWLSLVLLATAGASPNRSLPMPPIPPAFPPTAQSAPMPDRDAPEPVGPARKGVEVNLQDFRVQRPMQGLAYSPGSQFQSSEDKRSIQTPGLTVKVPLD